MDGRRVVAPLIVVVLALAAWWVVGGVRVAPPPATAAAEAAADEREAPAFEPDGAAVAATDEASTGRRDAVTEVVDSEAAADADGAVVVPEPAGGPLLLAGRVVDAGGAGLPDVPIRVSERHEESGMFGPRVSSEIPRAALGTVTDATGAFRIHGTSRHDLVLHAVLQGWVRREATCVAPGTFDVVIVLDQAGRLVANLDSHSVHLARRVATRVVEVGVHDDGNGTRAFGKDHIVRWANLRPGTYDFQVVGLRGSNVLWTVQGVSVVAGRDTDDPRLRDIELADVVRDVTVTVVSDHDGEPVVGETLFVYRGNSGHGQGLDANGEARLLVGPDGVEIGIDADGYRPVRRKGVAANTTIRLRRPLRVQITFRTDGPIELPGNARLQAVLNPDQPIQGEDGPRIDVAVGAAPVDASIDRAGEYSVQWSAAIPHDPDRSNAGSWFVYPSVDGPAPRVVVAEGGGLQSFEIVVPAAAVESAREFVAEFQVTVEATASLPEAERQQQRFEKLIELSRR